MPPLDPPPAPLAPGGNASPTAPVAPLPAGQSVSPTAPPAPLAAGQAASPSAPPQPLERGNYWQPSGAITLSGTLEINGEAVDTPVTLLIAEGEDPPTLYTETGDPFLEGNIPNGFYARVDVIEGWVIGLVIDGAIYEGGNWTTGYMPSYPPAYEVETWLQSGDATGTPTLTLNGGGPASPPQPFPAGQSSSPVAPPAPLAPASSVPVASPVSALAPGRDVTPSAPPAPLAPGRVETPPSPPQPV